ncbi:YD repeat-containing protein, partial [Arthrobacter bambusae]
RRRQNNEWVRRHNNRNWLEQFGDSLWGEEARPNMEPGNAPSFPSEAPASGSRETPGPGGGYGGGVSSARPESLRSFAAGSRGLDEGIASVPGSLEGELSSFADRCGWGRIDASGVVTAFRQYLQANEADAAWAVVVADAFAAAGAEGAVSTLSDAAVNEALAAAGVSGTRTGLVIDPPTAAGAVPSSGYANDPVNTATGNFIEPETDLGFAGAAADLVLTRMYNSLGSGLDTVGVFGPGWASVLDQHLVITDEGCRWVMADGRAVDFPREGAGWARAVGENYWLTREDAGTPWLAELASVPEGVGEVLVVADNQGAWWAYTTAGVWLGTGAGPGRTISAHRGEAVDGGGLGAVDRLVHVRGRFVEIDYVDGVVGVVRGSDGRRVEYGYDAEGRLVTVGTETGTRVYRWNEQGLIASVVSAAGVVEAENTYDEAGRVVLQVTQHGRRTRFAYLPGRVTVVSDEDGSRSNSWVADGKGRLVGVLDAEDRRQSMAYDGHGNLVSLTERDGAVTVHGYDGRGRKIRTVTPEGADLTYGWDEQDRITTLVTASGSVVTYEYADDLSRDPSVVVDPLGGRTELVWRDGLLTQVTDPVGVTIGFEYDEFGDLTGTSNAAGDVARIVRDRAGRPVTALSPSGAETRFSYDDAGVLVRRVDPDGAVWAFEHDTAGRTTAVVAPDGGRTVFEYAPNGELVRTTDPLGRSIERVVDELGNLTGAVLPDGARWGFIHDNLSRLIAVTDPAGHDWVREYDTVGALTAVVDPTGVRTGAVTDRAAGTASLTDAFASSTLSFDEYGRPTKIESVDGSAELVTYDGAGNPVELVDGEGGLTVLGRDAAGKITSITSPTGAVTRFEYDHCGRPWKSIDPVGAVTELSYDPDQRLTSRRLPTGEVETFAYDACGRLTAKHTPGEGTARYGYDKAGRLSFAQDSWYGTRRFEYNLAGELVSTINGVGGRTRFEYDTRGRLTKITDPTGGVTTRTYTATDQVDTVTDPLGRVTTATYDPAGRQLSQTDPDGHTTTWAYDAAGREASMSVDGALIAAIERDVAGRRVVITDHTAGAGYAVEHELVFDRRGLLTRRSNGTGTGSQVLGWEYDGDGNRTAFTDPTGTTTRYIRDAAGRVVKVSNPLLGDAAFTHDPSGRITTATAGQYTQEWSYRNGALVEHTRTHPDDPGTADVTLIGREDGGRITALTRNGAVTRYGYDT